VNIYKRILILLILNSGLIILSRVIADKIEKENPAKIKNFPGIRIDLPKGINAGKGLFSP